MDEREQQVRHFVINYIRRKWPDGGDLELEDDTNLVATGLVDSLGFIELLSEAEEQFGVEVDLEKYDPSEFTTLQTFVRSVLEAGGRA